MLCGSRCAFGVLPPISTPIIPVMHHLGGKRNADGLNKKRANPNERIHPNVLIFRKARHHQPTRCLAEPARCFLLPVRLPAADMELGENRTRLVSELICGGLTDCYAHASGRGDYKPLVQHNATLAYRLSRWRDPRGLLLLDLSNPRLRAVSFLQHA